MTKAELRRRLAADECRAELLDALAADGPHGTVLIERLRFGPPETWLAWLKGTGRVSVKLFPSGTQQSQDPIARTGFRHPLVAPLLAWNEDWIVNTWIDGRKLAPLPLPLPVFRQISQAVAALHGAGLAHGDLKPANVVMTAHGPVLIDWGEVTAGTPGWRPGTPHSLQERDRFALERMRP